MGRHVVRAFVSVGQIGHRRIDRRRHKPAEIILQIGLHLGVGVFLNQQAGRSVAHHQRQKTRTANPPGHIVCEFIKTGAIGLDLKRGLHDFQLRLELPERQAELIQFDVNGFTRRNQMFLRISQMSARNAKRSTGKFDRLADLSVAWLW